ncbi:NADH-quinone oxidoreductase subunit A [Candidatus Hecatella orcuttiae]|uniref:NADH-quinone oxidoreductase subunit A n=1 Tax=Candidatus Hecatella orcuttiae TaxID=1935119 RepID=UPI002867F14B|nr:NADH-quinone oxidoreductase subunit A [Candidatus Hecatella orcuttiae]
MADLLGLVVYIVIMLLFPIGLVLSGKIFGPSNPSPTKNLAFECGQVPLGDPRITFNIRYYPYAMIYAVFGAIAIFLLLTAPAIIRLGGEVSTFISISLAVVILALVSAVTSLRSARRRLR